MSNGISAQGTLIEQNGITIGELRDIAGPQRTRKVIDITTHNDSDNSIVVGIRRKGGLTVTVNYLPATKEAFDKSYELASLDEYKVIFPDNPVVGSRSYILFSGYVTDIGPKMPVDGDLTAAYTITPSGGHINFPDPTS